VKTLVIGFSIIALIGWVGRYWWPRGVPETHDGQIHIARTVNYYLALREGQIPPRWAPNLNAGFGYPVLNFNYPLANLLAVPLLGTGFSPQIVFKLEVIVALSTGMIGIWLFLKRLFGGWSAWVGTMLYGLAPYLAVDMYVRGSIGEVMSYALLPWILYMVDVQIRTPSVRLSRILAVFSGLFLISHNMTALLGSLFILGYIISGYDLKKLSRIVLPLGLGILLSTFFWLPAILEKQFIVVDASPLTQDYYRHFPTLGQLIYSGWGYGISYEGPVDGFTFQIGWSFWLLVVLGTWLVFRWRRKWKGSLYVLGTFWLAVFLMLPISKPLWRLPVLTYLQFPWRLLFFTSFSSVLVVSWVIKSLPRYAFWLGGGVVIVQLLSLMTFSGPKFDFPREYWFSYPHSGSTANENDPIWFRRDEAFAWFSQRGNPSVAMEGVGQINIEKWNGSRREYLIETTEPNRVVERTMYFPGWETYVDGKKVELKNNAKDMFGLINFKVPAGEHVVRTRFTQRTLPRIIGNSLTLTGVIAIFFYGRLTFYVSKTRVS